MLVSQNEVQARIEELRLGSSGYKRQLKLLDISPERRQRLEAEVVIREEESKTLEKIVQLGRVEEDREKIEAIVRERLEVLQSRLSADADKSGLEPDQYEYVSGEYKALVWALGEDALTKSLRHTPIAHRLTQDEEQSAQTVTAMLTRAIRDGRTVDMRASAAYDIGRLHLIEALPHLAAALRDDSMVADVALQALRAFSEAEMRDAGVADEVIRRVSGGT